MIFHYLKIRYCLDQTYGWAIGVNGAATAGEGWEPNDTLDELQFHWKSGKQMGNAEARNTE